MRLSSSSVRLISLDQDVQRRKRLSEIGIPDHVVVHYEKAIDFRSKSYCDVLPYLDLKYGPYTYGRVLSASEVGCALSHKEAYRSLQRASVELGVILEDDVRFSDEFGWGDVDEVYDWVSETWDKSLPFVLHLGSSPGDLARFSADGDRTRGFDARQGGIWNAHAYMISRPACAILSRTPKVSHLADDWLSISKLGIAIHLLEPGILFQDRSMDSTLSRFKKNNRPPLPSNSLKKFRYLAKKVFRTK